MAGGYDEGSFGKSTIATTRVGVGLLRRELSWPAGGDNRSQTKEARVTSDAREILASHPRFCTHVEAIQIGFSRDTLTLTDELPSYYTKQLLQETLRSLDCIQRIDNRICVVYRGGRSDVGDD